jgi:hypothetical protein
MMPIFAICAASDSLAMVAVAGCDFQTFVGLV